MSSASGAGDAFRLARTNMASPIQAVVFLILVAVTIIASIELGQSAPNIPVLIIGIVIAFLVAGSIKVANEWDRGVVLRMGKFHGIRGPGLFFIVPVIDRVRMIDTRVLTYHIREQEVITRDNVPVTIDSVLFYRVINAEDAVMKIQDYAFAIPQLAQRRLRDVVGGMTLDELLAEREQIAHQVEQHVETDSRAWGLHVTGIRLQDIDMPEELKKIMSRQAARNGKNGPRSPKPRGTSSPPRIWPPRRPPWGTAPAPCSSARCKPSTDSAPARRIPWCSPCPSNSWNSSAGSTARKAHQRPSDIR